MRATTLQALKTTLCALLAVTACHVALGQASRMNLDIKAQPMRLALKDLGEQTGLQIMVRSEDLERQELTAPRIEGELSAQEALERMLANTELEYRFVNANTVLIASKGRAGLAMEGRGVRMAQVEAQEGVQGEDIEFQEREDAEAQEEEDERGGIPEILVTGSKVRSLNMDIRRTEDDTQPYVVFDREEIENSGHVNLQEFFKHTLTMSTTEASFSQSAGSLFGGLSSINLRGLGSDETLILVDGRRIASMNASLFEGALQPDINSIPLAAIERIEVLPTTASGLYGGGATGGVINIVLRRDYSGVDVKLTYGNTLESDVTSRRVDLSAGQALAGGKTTLLFAGSVADRGNLFAHERDFDQRGREHVLRNNPARFYAAARPPVGATPNIRGAGGANLTLDDGTPLNSPITFIPVGYAGTLTDGGAALVANAGQYNLVLADTAGGGGQRRGLLNSPTTQSAMLTARQEFTPSVQVFLDLSAHENSSRSISNTAVIVEPISASAPNNPFQQDIVASVPAVGADGRLEAASRSRKAILGVIGKLSDDWQMEADFPWNKSSFSFDSEAGPLSSATIANIRSGALDVLRDVEQFGLELGLVPGIELSESDTVLKGGALRLAGALPLRLPGGNVSLSALAEYRKESYAVSALSTGTDIFVRPSQWQTVGGLYMEATLPIVAASNRLRGMDELEVQLAVRRDDYETSVVPDLSTQFLTHLVSTDPTIGVRYKPVSDVMLRASYGTGFLPPSTNQLTPGTPVEGLQFLGLTDPLRGNEPLGPGSRLFGGSTGLRPEESESRSVGAVIKPRWVPGLRFSADWSRTAKTDNITSIATFTQEDFNNEAFVPGLIIRGPRADGDPFPVGPVIAINGGLLNVASFDVTALDLALDYEFETARAGNFDITIGATYIDSMEVQLAPTSPLQENAGVANWGLKWRSNGSITWRRGGWMLGWSARFFDTYFVNTAHTVDLDQGSATVPSQTYHDIFGGYRLSAGGFLSNTELKFGVMNIFNTEPPVDVSGGPALRSYSRWGDPRLANYYLSMRKTFGN